MKYLIIFSILLITPAMTCTDPCLDNYIAIRKGPNVVPGDLFLGSGHFSYACPYVWTTREQFNKDAAKVQMGKFKCRFN